MSEMYRIWIKAHPKGKMRSFFSCLFRSLAAEGYYYNVTIPGSIEGYDSFTKRQTSQGDLPSEEIEQSPDPTKDLLKIIDILEKGHGGFLELGKTFQEEHYPVSVGIQPYHSDTMFISIGLPWGSVVDLGIEDEIHSTFQKLCRNLTKNGFKSHVINENELPKNF